MSAPEQPESASAAAAAVVAAASETAAAVVAAASETAQRLSEVTCDFMSKPACEERSKGQTWMFGTLLTLQLLCFSWLGYLSSRVMTMDVDYALTKGQLTQKLDDIDKDVKHLVDKMDKLQP
jgi:hypothetical protein